LPFDDFDCGVTLTPKVGRDSRVTVRQSQYSVPARFIGRRVRVSLRANDVVVFDRNKVIACHPRLTHRGQSHDDLDHYLEILLGKPGALAGSTALATARAERTFTAVHDAFWAATRKAHGDRDGTRLLIEVLLLHRHQDAEFVAAGITATLEAGSTSPDLVAIESRKAATRKAAKAHRDAHPLLDDADCAELGIDTVIMPAITDDTPDPRLAPKSSQPAGGEVISLRSRTPELHERPLPSLAIYDQLLTRRQKGTSA
jgi:hypothetical protein